MWIQPDDSVAQGAVIVKAIPVGVCMLFWGHPATIQAMADQYDLGYQQALGAVQWIKDNSAGWPRSAASSSTTSRFSSRERGDHDALKTGGDGITLIEQELQKINADEGFQFASTLLQAHPDIRSG